MSGPVLDCSLTAAWFFKDEHSPAADGVLEQVAALGAVAPVLWWAELRNVFVIGERNGRLTAADTTAALTEVEALGIRLDHSPDSASTLRLARTHGLTVYDALYLELAIREGRSLATLDRKLETAAKTEGVASLVDHG